MDTSKKSAASLGPASHNLLHQQMIAVSSRLDRQVSQLNRLNKLSNRLLGHMHGSSVAVTFAEAIVDVLDVAIGAVWVLGSPDNVQAQDFAVFGASGSHPGWHEVGAALAARLKSDSRLQAIPIDEPVSALVRGVPLVSPLACRCVGREGTTTAIVMAAHTDTVDGIFEPINDETLEMLKVLAEKCAAHLDNVAGRRRMESQLTLLRESEARLALVLRGTNDGWWEWNLITDTCFLSSRWLQMVLGVDSKERTQQGFWLDRVHDQDRTPFEALLKQTLTGWENSLEAEVRLLCQDNTYLPVLVRGTILRDSHGKPIRFAGSILDLSERKQYESHVHQLAFYDPLTELPNRRLLADRLQQALLTGTRTGQLTAVLMIDIDRFKRLNDTHGHAAGDQLLRSVADRLRESVRASDTVARLGGDEFVVLLENQGSDSASAILAAEQSAVRILRRLDEPYTLDVGVVHHSGSIGIAVPHRTVVTVDSMIKGADVALYEAKEAGRNMVCVYHPEMQRRVDRRAAMEAHLREGFDRSEVRLHYQAQVDEQGRIFGAEALMRWHPDGSPPVPPSEFIRVAEESGFIHSLGGWSLETACQQILAWGDSVPRDFRIAVNLSAPEFMHPNFPQRVVETLSRAGVNGNQLRLEITEATVVTELGFVSERMNLLRAHGIEFSLDDFGSGYSSLTYLRRLPVNEIKIDRSYVHRILHDPYDAAIVRAILAMCASFHLRVVAEGVETNEQRQRLYDDGCRHFQGYYFGQPQAAPVSPQGLINASAGRAR